MALTSAERAALVTLLKEEVKAEMRAAYADDVTNGQNVGSGNAGAAGQAGEPYNASAVKFEDVMSRLDRLHAKMDAMEERDRAKNEIDPKDDAEDPDGDEREGENEIPTKGQPRRLAADKDCRMDSLNSAHDRAHALKINAQARADAVMSLKNESAPRSLDGESPMGYRKRLLSSLKRYSPTWKDLDLGIITSDAVLRGVENTVYADAAEALKNPATWGSPDGELYERVELDDSGRKIKSFYSSIGPKSWMSAFSGSPARRVTGFRTRSND